MASLSATLGTVMQDLRSARLNRSRYPSAEPGVRTSPMVWRLRAGPAGSVPAVAAPLFCSLPERASFSRVTKRIFQLQPALPLRGSSALDREQLSHHRARNGISYSVGVAAIRRRRRVPKSIWPSRPAVARNPQPIAVVLGPTPKVNRKGPAAAGGCWALVGAVLATES
jgi:hypothetical protein